MKRFVMCCLAAMLASALGFIVGATTREPAIGLLPSSTQRKAIVEEVVGREQAAKAAADPTSAGYAENTPLTREWGESPDWIHGFVLSRNGTGLGGIEVFAEDIEGSHGKRRTVSDEDGYFRIEELDKRVKRWRLSGAFRILGRCSIPAGIPTNPGDLIVESGEAIDMIVDPEVFPVEVLCVGQRVAETDVAVTCVSGNTIVSPSGRRGTGATFLLSAGVYSFRATILGQVVGQHTEWLAGETKEPIEIKVGTKTKVNITLPVHGNVCGMVITALRVAAQSELNAVRLWRAGQRYQVQPGVRNAELWLDPGEYDMGVYENKPCGPGVEAEPKKLVRVQCVEGEVGIDVAF